MKAAYDTSSNTNNLYVLAKRYAESIDEPTADMINLVQSRKGRNCVTPVAPEGGTKLHCLNMLLKLRQFQCQYL